MSSIRIKCKNQTRPSARSLRDSLTAKGLNTKLLRLSGSTWIGTNRSLLVNWGCSSRVTPGTNAKVLNNPNNITNASNKLKSFELFEQHDVSHPWYVSRSDNDFKDQLVERVLDNTHRGFMFRTTATGYGGEGIHCVEALGVSVFNTYGNINTNTVSQYIDLIIEDISEPVVFVSEYFKACDEFRVHVVCGQVIFCQRKALRTDEQRPANPNFTVRNHANGFIFQQNNIEVPEVVKTEAIKAVQALGLDFGAVDIKAKQEATRPEHCAVLEVNSAPGISGNTLKAYTDVFKTIYNVVSS